MRPLVVNLRHLIKREVHLEGEIAPEVLELTGLDPMIRATAPVKYDLLVEKVDNALLVKGLVSTQLNCQCGRCLVEFVYPVDLKDFAVDITLEGEEAAVAEGDFVDLTPYLREDILLSFPQHPLCKTECGGLQEQPSPGNEAQLGQESQMTSSAWAVLNELKLK